jgi:hypothetical protein
MIINYANHAASARAARNTASRVVFDRIVDLILKLDRVVDYIPPDDLGGANEAHTTIDELVDFLEGLRRM